MVNPNRITGWEIVILLLCTALLCLMVDNSPDDPAPTPRMEQAVQP